jgi:hypothetical protein
MADYTIKRFDEMEPILGGVLRRTRASLGATSFGMQILNMPPDGGDFYPNHDHAESGQEGDCSGGAGGGGLVANVVM